MPLSVDAKQVFLKVFQDQDTTTSQDIVSQLLPIAQRELFNFLTQSILPLRKHHIKLFELLLITHHYDHCITFSQQVLAQNPNNHFARKALAIAYLRQDQYDQTIEHANHVLTQNPSDAYARNMLARAYLLKDQSDQAIEHANQVLTQRPNDPDARNTLARAYLHQEQYNQAIEHANQVLARRPNDPYARNTLDRALLKQTFLAKEQQASANHTTSTEQQQTENDVKIPVPLSPYIPYRVQLNRNDLQNILGKTVEHHAPQNVSSSFAQSLMRQLITRWLEHSQHQAPGASHTHNLFAPATHAHATQSQNKIPLMRFAFNSELLHKACLHASDHAGSEASSNTHLSQNAAANHTMHHSAPSMEQNTEALEIGSTDLEYIETPTQHVSAAIQQILTTTQKRHDAFGIVALPPQKHASIVKLENGSRPAPLQGHMLAWYFLASEQKVYFLDASLDADSSIPCSVTDDFAKRASAKATAAHHDDAHTLYLMRLDDKIKPYAPTPAHDTEPPRKRFKSSGC